MKKNLLLIAIFLPLLIPCKAQTAENWQAQIRRYVQHGAVLAVNQNDKVLFELNAEAPLIPASTLKVATSLAALKLLGEDYRFKTEFFLDKENCLYGKGYGDPFLISEELSLIADQLKNKGLSQVKEIILDGSFFEAGVKVPGLVGSLNPYDAYNGALLANFNTIDVIKYPNGNIASGEPQTPITDITKRLAVNAPIGRSRINVAMYEKDAPLYVGYLLKEFLIQRGVVVKGEVRVGKVDPQAKLFYSHTSTKDLKEVLQPALKYSQNLIMNQLFLTIGAVKLGAPANLEKSKKVVSEFLQKEVGLKNFNLEEGSGISRQNKFTAKEMAKVLSAFSSYRPLLPMKGGMWVKTGSLTGVSSLVGYFQSENQGWIRFVIILNQGSNHRDQIARLLYENLK
jgi:D-alanyl-D-alanine carboxypeptidase/D-alanyl-D-alanine-endopeptidase (penicillin-binding protein 4)